MKLFYSLLFCCTGFVLLSQSMTKINLAVKEIVMNEVVGSSVSSNFGIASGTKICGLNCTNTYSNKNGIMVFPFYDQTYISSGFFIYHKSGNFYLNKLVFTGSDEVFFVGTYNEPASPNLMIFGVFSLKLRSLKILKSVSLTTDPAFAINPVDVLYANNTFYILAESWVQYASNLNSKIVLIKFDGIDILWSYIYNSVAPIHSESPRSLAMAPNGNLCVGGTIKRSGDNAPRMMLAQIDVKGNPVLLKSVELLSADSTFNNRYGWTYVKSKGENIHLLSQSIIGSSEPGAVLVTMFDNDFKLKTWRNYTAPIRVESANIDGNFFLFGGQAPIEAGWEGFALMKVNSLNAIVEQFRNYKVELTNSNIATSSSSVYDRATDRIWTVIKPNGSAENYVILLENSSNLDNPCAEDFTSIVAKDPMQLTDIPFNARSLQLQLSDIDPYVSEIALQTKEICNVTKSNELSQDKTQLFPNPSNDGFTISSNKIISKISIFNSMGLAISQQKFNGVKYHFNSKLIEGMYLIQITFEDRNSSIRKLIVN